MLLTEAILIPLLAVDPNHIHEHRRELPGQAAQPAPQDRSHRVHRQSTDGSPLVVGREARKPDQDDHQVKPDAEPGRPIAPLALGDDR